MQKLVSAIDFYDQHVDLTDIVYPPADPTIGGNPIFGIGFSLAVLPYIHGPSMPIVTGGGLSGPAGQDQVEAASDKVVENPGARTQREVKLRHLYHSKYYSEEVPRNWKEYEPEPTSKVT